MDKVPLFYEIFLYVFMFIFGAGVGSFLCCQARRLRRREEKKKPLGRRSVCPHCGKKLKWFENLPLLSWLFQRGRCRNCHRKIGAAEFLSELLTALAFVILAITLKTDYLSLFITTIFTSSLIFLAIYDGLYGELPQAVLTFSIICAIIISALRLWAIFSNSQFSWQPVVGLILSAAILGGLYLLLFLLSKGKWVGDGDWLLGLAIGIAMGNPFAALIALFTANLSACIVMAPSAIKHHSHQIYFGPFLVFGYLVGTFAISFFVAS